MKKLPIVEQRIKEGKFSTDVKNTEWQVLIGILIILGLYIWMFIDLLGGFK